MLVKMGDIVRIRSDLEENKEYYGHNGNWCFFFPSMTKYKGQTLTVILVGLDSMNDLFLVDENPYVWSTTMIETLPYSELKAFLEVL